MDCEYSKTCEINAQQEAKSEFETIFGKVFPQKEKMINSVINSKARIKHALSINNTQEAERELFRSIGYIEAYWSLGYIDLDEFRKLRDYLKEK